MTENKFLLMFSSRWLTMLVRLAFVLNGFAFGVVNYWIYTARWWFIETQSHVYSDPPTISRAISPDYIGIPFSFWITLSGLVLIAGVAIMVLRYWIYLHSFQTQVISLLVCRRIILPMIVLMQVASALGMHWLSYYRFPNFHSEHMTGSYIFFVGQALVIVLYLIINTVLWRSEKHGLSSGNDNWVSLGWVKVRIWLCWLTVVLVCLYFGFFLAKSHTSDALVYLIYVSLEPVVITMFLMVLMASHGGRVFTRSHRT